MKDIEHNLSLTLEEIAILLKAIGLQRVQCAFERHDPLSKDGGKKATEELKMLNKLMITFEKEIRCQVIA